MNKEEMNKFAYELMIKNNQREVYQRLLLLDKLQQRIDKAIEYINEAINYPKGCGLEPLNEIYAENIIDRLKGDGNNDNN